MSEPPTKLSLNYRNEYKCIIPSPSEYQRLVSYVENYTSKPIEHLNIHAHDMDGVYDIFNSSSYQGVLTNTRYSKLNIMIQDAVVNNKVITTEFSDSEEENENSILVVSCREQDKRVRTKEELDERAKNIPTGTEAQQLQTIKIKTKDNSQQAQLTAKRAQISKEIAEEKVILATQIAKNALEHTANVRYKPLKREYATYIGETRNGKEHGLGMTIKLTGERFEGQYKHGERYLGRCTLPNEETKVGEFGIGETLGYNSYNYRNGDLYLGQNIADLMHGVGVYVHSNGSKYEGEFNAGERCGFCVYNSHKGDMYEGKCDGNEKEEGFWGFVRHYDRHGGVEEGYWEGNKKDGYAIYKNSEGSEFKRKY